MSLHLKIHDSWKVLFGIGAAATLACAASSKNQPDLGDATTSPEAATTHDTGVKPNDAGRRDTGANDAVVGAPETGPSIPDAGAGETSTSADTGGGTCGSPALCDNFDQDTADTQPTGWSVVMGCNPQTQDTAVDGGLIIGVDSTEHHSGMNSVRVVGGDSCGYYFVNKSAVSSLGSQLYARFWVMFSGAPTANHNGFLSMATTSMAQLRLGFQGNVVDWNAFPPDCTLPDLDPQGEAESVATEASTWTCMELHVDETSGEIEFWLNGTSVSGLGYSGMGPSTQGVNDQWASGVPTPLVPTSFGLGWLGLNNQYTVWYDDVVLSGSRIGCDCPCK
jgi:hypothetical protein